jgi:hypothetical protein
LRLFAAFEGGFDPSFTDDDGGTIHQIGKTGSNDAIELLARGDNAYFQCG